MESNKSFLEVWKEVFYRLRDDGLITDEDIKKGVDLPFEWLYSSGIHKDVIILALRNLYENEHPNNRYKFEKFKKLANLRYCEKEGNPSIEVSAGKCSVFITDEKMKSDGWTKNATIQEFCNKIISAKKRLKMFELEEKGKLSKEAATLAVGIFYDEKQIQSELYAMPHNLSEMAINFGEYYKYIQQEEQIANQEEIKEEEPLEISGGIIDPAVDDTILRGPNVNPTRPRVSEIYPFEERRKIFLELGPEQPIVKFQGIDKETGKVIDRYMTCYIYKNPQGNKGYLITVEPLQGDKETRIFYLTDEEVKDLMSGEDDIQKFWKDLSREFVEKMTRTQFSKEGQTYTVRHTGDLEDYKQKIQGIVKGVENNSQKETVKRASYKLFGKATMVNGLACVRRSGFEKAKRMVLGERENTQEEKGEDVTND